MVKEVVEPMLDEGQPEEKLQEPYYYGERMECVDVGCGLNHTPERALDARATTD
jgi:hypothetical protein